MWDPTKNLNKNYIVVSGFHFTCNLLLYLAWCGVLNTKPVAFSKNIYIVKLGLRGDVVSIS
jgi:hypothetical protein